MNERAEDNHPQHSKASKKGDAPHTYRSPTPHKLPQFLRHPHQRRRVDIHHVAGFEVADGDVLLQARAQAEV
jgi:hypothetical protein